MKTIQKSNSGLHQPNRGWYVLPLTVIVITMLFSVVSSNAQIAPTEDMVNGFDNDVTSADYNNNNPTANSVDSWIYWYNGGGTVGLDTTVFKDGGGSLKVTIPFTPTYRQIDQGAWFGNFMENDFPYDNTIVYDGTQFTNISFDIMMDPSDPISSTGDYGYIGVGLLDSGTPGGARADGTVLIPGSASNTWFHVTVPVHKTPASDEPYLSSPGVIGVSFRYSTYDNNNYNVFLTNPVVLHIDNLVVKLGAVSNPPPVMSIKTATPGLNFVQGSVSSQFDRQNIRTLNAPSSSFSWAGKATAGTPVTYSYTVSKWNAPDDYFHIFITPNGTLGESASDYNEATVLNFQVGLNTNGNTVATILWKTNAPNSNANNVAIAVTNSVALVGTWQLKFTSDTGGSIIEPDASSYPFTLDPGVAAGLANPGPFITFGIQPQGTTTNGNVARPQSIGESVVVSQISITGVDPLSGTIATTDNFLNDSALDTNTWAVNALFPASIVFVPTNISYLVRWTIPASGFSLEINPAIATNGWVVPSTVSSVTLFPGVNTLIPKSTLPAGKSAFFRLAKLTPTQLQVLFSGETNAPGTVTGKVGTPTPVNVGDFVTVTINEVDANWNIVSSTDTVHITSATDPTVVTQNDAALVNGSLTRIVQFDTAGSQTVTATDTTNPGTIAPNTSSSVTVN
jgi:hypothetical protein